MKKHVSLLLIAVALAAAAFVNVYLIGAGTDLGHYHETTGGTRASTSTIAITTTAPAQVAPIIGAMAVLPDGRMFSLGATSYLLQIPARTTYGRYSHDCGRTWTQPFPIGAELMQGMVEAYGKLFVIYHDFNTGHSWMLSSSNGASWNIVQQLPNFAGYVIASGMDGIVTKKGTILLPISYSKTQSDMNYTSTVWISNDQGTTWNNGGSVYVQYGADEPSIVEGSDGSVIMVVRTALQAHYLARSFDDGRTWSAPQRTSLYDPSSPANIFRVSWNPDILGVLWNAGPGRSHLTAAYSFDNAYTWVNQYLISADYSQYPLVEVCSNSIVVTYWNWNFGIQTTAWLPIPTSTTATATVSVSVSTSYSTSSTTSSSTTSVMATTTHDHMCRNCKSDFWNWLRSLISWP